MYVLYNPTLCIGTHHCCDVNFDIAWEGTIATWLVPGTFDGDGECLPEFLYIC